MYGITKKKKLILQKKCKYSVVMLKNIQKQWRVYANETLWYNDHKLQYTTTAAHKVETVVSQSPSWN